MSSAGLNVMHACLSDQVVDGLLRSDLKFDGVVISECLEMEALSHNIGVGGGTVMAVNAGCDLILLCRSFTFQKDAIAGLKEGIESSIITQDRIQRSLRRVLAMKSQSTSWEKALNPPGIKFLTTLQPSHTSLSTKAYNNSITVVRDREGLLPLNNIMEFEEELLLLTPLVKPLAASAAARAVIESMSIASPEPHVWERSASVMSGERVFRELGRALARNRNGRVLHTSYTANGVRPIHENLISRAAAVVIITADANRNLYQQAFTKHMAMLCKGYNSNSGDRKDKPFIVVSVSSPYDFAVDPMIGTYICTYDFTETALTSLVKVLYGDITPRGQLPGSISQNQKIHPARQHWLVEAFNEERDAHALDDLISTVVKDAPHNQPSELAGATSNSILLHHPDVVEGHFVVRNSSTHALYGFVATYYFRSTGTGVIGALFVEPSRRKLSIGRSLHHRAIRTLLQREGAKRFQLGSRIPSIFLGIPTGNSIERRRLRSWFANMGWNTALSRQVSGMIAHNLSSWAPPTGVAQSIEATGARFDLVRGWEYAGPILNLIQSNNRQGLAELYKIALNDATSCGVIRAKRREDGALVGAVVLYNSRSQLAEFVPATRGWSEQTTVPMGAPPGKTGGISSPVISPAVGEYSALLQGLILLSLRQFKQQGCDNAYIDFVSSAL